ncbi:MAG: hypothetical protein ACRD1N_01185 [Terriglobia bacterium]
MATTKESRLKKVFEKAENDVKKAGRGIKKGATGVEHVIEKEFVRKGAKQAKQ